jgi:hypothetical protein
MDLTLTLNSAPTSKPLGDGIVYECRPEVSFSKYPIICDLSADQFQLMTTKWNSSGAGVTFDAKLVRTKLKPNKVNDPSPADWDYYFRAASVDGVVDEIAMKMVGIAPPASVPQVIAQVSSGPYVPGQKELQILKAAAEVTVPFAKALCEAMAISQSPDGEKVASVEMGDLIDRYAEFGNDIEGLVAEFMMNVCDRLMTYTMAEPKEVTE